MRVLFTVSDWTTNWFSLVPLGWGFQSSGHEVRVLCAPSQAEAVARAGLVPVPILVGAELEVTARVHNCRQARAGRWPFQDLPPHPVTGLPLAAADEFDSSAWFQDNMERLVDNATRSTDAAVAYAHRWRSHLVVHDPMSVEGPLLGRVAEVPALLHLWGPVSPHDPVPGVPQDEENKATFVPVDLSDAFGRHGVGTMGPEVYEHVVDPCPAAVAPPVTGRRIEVRYVPYNGPGHLPDELMGPPGKPRVCVVWGTSVSAIFGPGSFPVPRVVEALAGLDVEVVFALTAQDRERTGPLPEGMHVLRDYVPLHLLLPECDLVVHHGGGGCTMTALAAAVPQLMLPPGHDQEVIGPRLARAGVAQSVHNAAAEPSAIRSAAARLLTDRGFRDTAQRLAAEMAHRPHPAALAASLAELAQARVRVPS
ncbi:DUF1205 domain-containing protein [Streptomyces pimonensis]|uniref:DUF1205 domain-containing protein n=1 Tax=Streptomyces pimonensis TaxID=2860288 RepID=A0ABV4J6I5_9ACTN